MFGQPLPNVIRRDGSQIPYCIETCIEFLQTNNGVVSPPLSSLTPLRLTPSLGNGPILLLSSSSFLVTAAHEEEGIFRRSGSKIHVMAIKEQFDKNEHIDMVDFGDPHVIAGVIKLFLQELPEPLIPFHLFDGFVSICEDLPLPSPPFPPLLPSPAQATCALLVSNSEI